MKNQELTIGTILISGISASGKTRLGRRLFRDLEVKGINNVTLFDGEETRALLEEKGLHFGFSMADRVAHTRELTKLAIDCNAGGDICIICAIASCKTARDDMRNDIGNFMEVYLDCPVEVCAERDYKGQYKRALDGLYETFIGVTDPYETSDNPQLVLRTHKMDVKQCSTVLFENVLKFVRNGTVHSSGE